MAIILGDYDVYLNDKKEDNKKKAVQWLLVCLLIGLTTFFGIVDTRTISSIKWIFLTILASCLIILQNYVSIIVRYAKDYKQGLIGERLVRESLDKLSNDYFVFANLHLPGQLSNIDFVVVGPTGIYVIEVKSHKGTISFDGNSLRRVNGKFEKDFINQTMSAALNLNSYLLEKLNQDLFVVPILCFSSFDAIVINNGQRIRNVYVLKKRRSSRLHN